MTIRVLKNGSILQRYQVGGKHSKGRTFESSTPTRRDTFHTNRAFAYLLDVYSPDRESFVSLPQGADATRANR